MLTAVAVVACSGLPSKTALPEATGTTADVKATIQAAVAMTVTALSTPFSVSPTAVIIASPTAQPTPSALAVASATTQATPKSSVATTSDVTSSVQRSLDVRFADAPDIRSALVKAEILGHTLRATTSLNASDPNLSDVLKAFGGWSLECTNNKRDNPATAIDLVDRQGHLLMHDDVTKLAGICLDSTLAMDVPATPEPPSFDTQQATTELHDYLGQFAGAPWYDNIKQIKFRTGVVEITTDLSDSDGAKLGPVCTAVSFWANAQGDGGKYKLVLIDLVTATNTHIIDLNSISNCAVS